jgi:cysteine synthase A
VWQFNNPANIEVHARTTAQEILADFPNGVDAVITGVGTGGHITGTPPSRHVFVCSQTSECPSPRGSNASSGPACV